MQKAFFTLVFCFAVFFCSAQKQLLSYTDLQYIIQNKPEAVKSFFKEKNYQLQPTLDESEAKFFCLFSDEDYADITINFGTRRTALHLTTTNKAQVEAIQKAVSNYPSKNKQGVDIYRVKDGTIATIGLKEEEKKGRMFNLFTIDIEN